ncbi:MAG: hypothetical protein KC800_22770, partial [Candidatus Eremiobacteraeota bacterium]|nr:hypothetical protein [Candidatus Eremiobacteraeota bacterium]
MNEAEKSLARLAERLSPEHFRELESMKSESLWSDVPLWLWSPILSDAEVEMIAGHTEELCKALLDFGRKELAEGRATDWLPPDPGLRKSVAADGPETDPCFNWRFDFLWERRANQLTFLEVNAGDPSGLGWVDVFTRDMGEHSLWRDFLAEGRCFSLFDSLQRATLQRVGCKAHICLISAASCTVSSDVRCLGKLYERSGWKVSLADPGEFPFSEDACSLKGERVDVIFRDTYEELFWPPREAVGEGIIQAQKAGKLIVLNPLSASFWDIKSLWSRLPSTLSTVPATRHLGMTDVEQMVEERERWVIKPSHDYGGRGVSCGYATEPGKWREAVLQAAGASREFIAQQRAPGGS